MPCSSAYELSFRDGAPSCFCLGRPCAPCICPQTPAPTSVTPAPTAANVDAVVNDGGKANGDAGGVTAVVAVAMLLLAGVVVGVFVVKKRTASSGSRRASAVRSSDGKVPTAGRGSAIRSRRGSGIHGSAGREASTGALNDTVGTTSTRVLKVTPLDDDD